MIAMALACDPPLVIADEPTRALDVMIQAQILNLLAQLREERNLALLVVTDDLSVLAQVTNRVAVMYAGRIVEEGSATALRAHSGRFAQPWVLQIRARLAPRRFDYLSRGAKEGLLALLARHDRPVPSTFIT
jgi:peptide/nickel transport system ATP-binding protein